MDDESPSRGEPLRYVGMDVHKHYLVIGAVDRKQTVILPPRRVAVLEFAAWATRHLTADDAVVLEATSNAWHLHDQLAPLVGSVTVANAAAIKLISQARVKTDARDAINLARLLAAHLVPTVWVPPVAVRELRGLVMHRRRLVAQRVQAGNRLQAVLQRHQIVPPEGDVFSQANRAWWEQLALPASERLRVRQDLALQATLNTLIEEAEVELRRQSTLSPWVAQVPYLVQLSGIGVLAAITVLAAVGDIARFPAPKNLVGYAGLGSGVHASGQVFQTGRITKQGRRELRGAMVEAAWVAVEHHPRWKAEFARLCPRLGRQKAIVAIARKLLVVVWHVLAKHEADRHGEPAAMARAIHLWLSRSGIVPGRHRPLRQLVLQEVRRLGLEVSEIVTAAGKPLMTLPPDPVAQTG
jgi:transposase